VINTSLSLDPEFVGAVSTNGLASFRVWASQARRVEVHVDGATEQRITLTKYPDGYFGADDVDLPVGTLYKYVVDEDGPWPDPCSRFQPHGPHGPSQLVDPQRFAWTDDKWRGATLERQVIYELHIGTFTDAGTFDAACERLQYLKELGITMLELLPVGECPGRWNWGYDGVQLYAPWHQYGDHDALKRFVNSAHALGLAVILDVVYNHLGPDGNYLQRFSPHYFSDSRTEWGDALNFDGEQCRGTRDLIVNNVRYWLREFHVDGFRLDATQAIVDTSPIHMVADLITSGRRTAAPRSIVFIAENEPQRGEQLLPPTEGGFGLDGMWNDDFHHSARVALTGSRDGYFHDYRGRAQEFVSAAKYGFLYQGQHYYWQNKQRGSPLPRVPRSACIHFLQNHDQVGNSFVGDRVHTMTSPGLYRAATALALLGPQTPLLFMGQEFLASSRFMFFADHHDGLRQKVRAGRREFMQQFRAFADTDAQEELCNPADEATFQQSKLKWDELEEHAPALLLHQDLLRLRRDDPVLATQNDVQLDGATLDEHAFVLRWFGVEHGDRLLIVNFGSDTLLDPAPEPLLAPPPTSCWHLAWSSENPRYGGHGAVSPVFDDNRWRVPGRCAVLLRSEALTT
jgi:maltooligosyltrehalose trehalohydrolase